VIELRSLSGKTIAVMGLGLSGLATARALTLSGATVLAWDDNDGRRAKAAEDGVDIQDLTKAAWSGVDALVLSPGIPHTHPAPHPVAALARDAGVEIIGDIELLGREQQDAHFIGITGTNGKSTTTALIGHIFGLAGKPTQVGGNLGRPALDLEPLDAQGDTQGHYILEMSSFQLDLTPTLTFDIAVLLNLSPDHIDRHGDFAGYIAAKKRIFAGMEPGSAAIIGIDDPNTRALYDELRSNGGPRVVPISVIDAIPDGVYVLDGVLYDAMEGDAKAVTALGDIDTLPGRHNAQNAAAAYTAARTAGLPTHHIIDGLRSYPGLPHRQQIVADINGVRYVNDSKATNPDATANALASYEAIYWIAGGLGKEGGLDQLLPYLPHIEHAFLIGAAAEDIRAAISGKVPLEMSGALEPAVRAAHAMAQQSRRDKPVVLLSPACASYDQFPNFEVRGDAFAAIVDTLNGGDHLPNHQGEARV
jgi:UDP-N-acetylmuramoylalanine--D-glutamate ligase